MEKESGTEIGNSLEFDFCPTLSFLCLWGKPRKLKLEQLGFKEILMGNFLFLFAI